MALRPEHLYKATVLLLGLALFYRLFVYITQTLLLGILAVAFLGTVLWLGVLALLGQIHQLFGGLFGLLGILLALPIVIFAWTVVEVLGRARDRDGR